MVRVHGQDSMVACLCFDLFRAREPGQDVSAMVQIDPPQDHHPHRGAKDTNRVDRQQVPRLAVPLPRALQILRHHQDTMLQKRGVQGQLVGPGIFPPISGVLWPPPGAMVLGAIHAGLSWSLALGGRNPAPSGSSATSTTTPRSVLEGTGRRWAARMCRTRNSLVSLISLICLVPTGRWLRARM
jgi:hypothetical protein